MKQRIRAPRYTPWVPTLVSLVLSVLFLIGLSLYR
jgi:hypothetical protein